MLRTAWLRSTRNGLACRILIGGLTWTIAVALHARSGEPEPVPGAATPPSDACATLRGLPVEAGSIDSASRFDAGEVIQDGETAGATTSVALCRVRLRLQPQKGSNISVEIWLPTSWNGNLQAFGGGGFDGSLSPDGAQHLNVAVRLGYAAVLTDVGHKPASGLEPWVHQQPEKVLDFGHRGNHLAAVVAKQVIAAHYGRPVRYAYFSGCSNGGRDGLMAASRYPEDYDGVIAGAPANRYLEVLTKLIWNHRVVHGPGGVPDIAAKLPLVHAAVMQRCDALDGVKDELLENPLACRFDPGELRCQRGQSRNCLLDREVSALRKLYGGPRLPNGRPVMRGPALGSEGVADNWSAWVTTPQAGTFGQEFYRWMVFDDPNWTLERFRLGRDYPLARRRIAPILNVESADLGAFMRRGGKLLIYQGWNDPVISAAETIQYFEAVQARGGAAARQQVRLFMVPGMGHCAGGPGATRFDAQLPLVKWVEQGQAPERLIAINAESGLVAGKPFSRPLCPWPQTARYQGWGSTAEAANFHCQAPR